MPKAPMDDAEIREKKEKIIDIAAEIVMEDGFQSLSMRKIGSRIGMTAANLYNYYANKDELNIAIRTRAGKLLYEALSSAFNNGGPIVDIMARLARAYMEFGMERPNYYSILFDMPTPKYADYVGTDLEELALKEKESTEQSFVLMNQCMEEMKKEGYRLPDNPEPLLILIWGQLHGLVSLYTNKLISEISPSPENTITEAASLAHYIMFAYMRKNREGDDAP